MNYLWIYGTHKVVLAKGLGQMAGAPTVLGQNPVNQLWGLKQDTNNGILRYMYTHLPYGWWKKSRTTCDVQNTVNTGIFTIYHINWLAGFLPSTVWTATSVDLSINKFHTFNLFTCESSHSLILALDAVPLRPVGREFNDLTGWKELCVGQDESPKWSFIGNKIYLTTKWTCDHLGGHCSWKRGDHDHPPRSAMKEWQPCLFNLGTSRIEGWWILLWLTVLLFLPFWTGLILLWCFGRIYHKLVTI